MQYIKNFKELTPFFQDIGYSDIKTIEGRAELRGFVSGMLSYYPWWIILLYRIRALLVKILGLVKHEKPEKLPALDPDKLSFTPGDIVTFFKIVKAEEKKYWIAETPDDKHLTAFFGVVSEELDSGLTRFHVFTNVKYRHWTGPVYFNLIRPFHHLVVRRMMKAGLKYKFIKS